MTSDERKRMNELCLGIQEEQEYQKFAAMLHEMTELIERKEQRRFPNEPKLVLARNKPWTSMAATATKLLSSVDGPDKKVEISIPAADDLFREIRIDNKLVGIDGSEVALVAGSQLRVTVEAGTDGSLRRAN